MTSASRRPLLLFLGLLVVPSIIWGPAIVDSLRGEGTPAAFAPAPARIGSRVTAIHVLDEAGGHVERSLVGDHRATVIWFWSALCPCVAECEERIRRLLDRYDAKDVVFLAVDANPQDSREDIERLRKKLGSPYPVLRDDDGRTIHALGIEASASVAVLDGAGTLRYRGAIDDDLYAPTVSYVHRALDAMLAGETFSPTEVPPYGCQYPLAGE